METTPHNIPNKPNPATCATSMRSSFRGGSQHKCKHLAIVTMGVKLGDETRGYTRFRFLAELLVREGFTVDLITSSFQHWEKEQRNCSKACYQNLPYRVVFIDEPGYTKNLDLARILSHRVAAKNLRAHFARELGAYDLIYAEIPPNDVARVCAQAAKDQDIPFVADINDLWPEAMRMVVDIPLVSDLAFYPFTRDAKQVYQLLSGAVGTSDEYTARPAKDREAPYPHTTVYVGNDLSVFDEGVRKHSSEIHKPSHEFWVSYAGTLGASYDVKTLIDAGALLEQERQRTLATMNANFQREHAGVLNTLRNNARFSHRLKRQSFTPASLQGGDESPCEEVLGKPNATTLFAFGPSFLLPSIRVKILGDGPDREKLEAYALERGAPVDFLGYTEYERMAAYLRASDIVVNSLVKSAVQSVVTKIGDYLASGRPMINTGSSPEFRAKVEADGFGINVEAQDAPALAREIGKLAKHTSRRKIMGAKARAIAEREFDQPQAYRKIVDLLRTLV